MQKPQMDTSDTAFIYADIRSIDWQHACTITESIRRRFECEGEEGEKKMIKQDDIRFFFSGQFKCVHVCRTRTKAVSATY